MAALSGGDAVSNADDIRKIALDPAADPKNRSPVVIRNGRILPRSVFVPWETMPDGRTVRCNNLPRFCDIDQARTYLFKSWDLARRRISWIEDFSDLAKEEFLAGYGTE